MDSKIEIVTKVPASKKLQQADAKALLKGASRLIVAKGKKVSEFTLGARVADDTVAAMLGPTGNLRAPTAVVGKTVVVGFNDATYTGVFG
ncbi:MAG: ArsC family (seleno)protein [Proteobacteria bacterium]|nr:ArsC family (seleno)protein [Pseudomonadota bacterium]